MTDSTVISKIWNLAGVLRDDGVGYGDYLEQITYLLFLKMADELNKPPYSKGLKFPKLKDVEGKEIVDGETCDWETLSNKRGAESGLKSMPSIIDENASDADARDANMAAGTAGEQAIKDSKSKKKNP